MADQPTSIDYEREDDHPHENRPCEGRDRPQEFSCIAGAGRGCYAGTEAEAVRIAGVLRNLVHSTGMSRALLDELGVKYKLRYPNTANRDSRQGMWRLQIWHDGNRMRGRYLPIGHERVAVAPWIPFKDWWQKVVLIDSMRNKFSRKLLILLAANKDGHAHIDPVIPAEHADLVKRNSAGWGIANNDDLAQPFEGNVLRVMTRQIGIELEAAVLCLQSGRDLGRFHAPYVPAERPSQ